MAESLYIFPRRIEEVSGGEATLDLSNGFESPFSVSDATPWGAVGTYTVGSGDDVHSGSQSLGISSNGVYLIWSYSVAAQTELWVDFWIKCEATTETVRITELTETTSYNWMSLQINSSNYIVTSDWLANTWGGTSVQITENAYWHIFWHVIIATSNATIQMEANQASTRSTWSYSNTSASIDSGFPHADSFLVAKLAGTLTDQFYFDDARLYYGPGEPSAW